MSQNKFSLREQKFGDKRVEILDIFIKELETKMIQSISVDSICETAKISKVTFFKYFESKEQALYYFIHKWQYTLSYHIETKKFLGASGVYHVFETVTGEKYSLNIMLAIIQYFIKLESPPQPMNISDYEYYLFNTEAYELDVPKRDLREILMYYLNSMNCKKINTTLESLFSVFYGVPVIVHMLGREAELWAKYKNAVSAILNDC
jgi:AcrR family transcriptional regulator